NGGTACDAMRRGKGRDVEFARNDQALGRSGGGTKYVQPVFGSESRKRRGTGDLKTDTHDLPVGLVEKLDWLVGPAAIQCGVFFDVVKNIFVPNVVDAGSNITFSLIFGHFWRVVGQGVGRHACGVAADGRSDSGKGGGEFEQRLAIFAK